jgi:hypothetical protein
MTDTERMHTTAILNTFEDFINTEIYVGLQGIFLVIPNVIIN